MFKKIMVQPTMKLIQVIEAIDKGRMQIALVCDSKGVLLGTVTDGDVRRGILRGLTLESPISQAMNDNPYFVKLGTEPAVIQKLMFENKISHIPVVDDNRVVVGMDFDSALQEHMSGVPVVLMAGGRGARLLPLTKDVPKPMLKLGDKPILEIIIENLRACGCRDFFISVNYKSEVIKNHFGDGAAIDVKINYLEEERPLGTAGSLALLPKDLNKPFIVMNGDVLTRVNFKKLIDFHIKHEAVATMCLKSYEIDVPYGVVSLSGIDIQQIDEKPVQKFFVNAGIYVFDPSVRNYISSNEHMDMTTLYTKIKNQGGKVIGFPLHEYWVDVGRKSDLRKATHEFES